MIWRYKNSSLIITAELHKKIVESCQRIDQTPSQVLALRQARSEKMAKGKKRRSCASQALMTDSLQKIAALSFG